MFLKMLELHHNTTILTGRGLCIQHALCFTTTAADTQWHLKGSEFSLDQHHWEQLEQVPMGT